MLRIKHHGTYALGPNTQGLHIGLRTIEIEAPSRCGTAKLRVTTRMVNELYAELGNHYSKFVQA
jgi:hypothetical protein